MIDIQDFLAQPAFRALGFALLHFLWQGTLAALLFAACNIALRQSTARVRYAVGCLFPMVFLALPVLTFAALLFRAPALSPVPARLPALMPAAAPLALLAPAIARASLQDSLTPYLPWIVALWIAGVLLLSMRWIGAGIYLHRLRCAASLPVPPAWEHALHDLIRRAAVTVPVRLSIHRLTPVPCTIGWLRPIILMPAASLASLDWRALEALLAHELAHIRRHDYLVNLLQTTVDTLLFYHPAVWWVSRQIRMERENCCDDFAAQLCRDRAAYARALIDLEQIRSAEPAFAMCARGGSLTYRIQRLLCPTLPQRRGPAWFPLLAGVAIIACMAAAVFSPPAVSAAQPEKTHDFLTGIIAAGFRNLTVDELIELKIHGVTPEFASGVKQAGYTNVTAEELTEMAIHGVDLDFIRAMKNKNGARNPSIEQLIRLKQSGFEKESP